MADNLPQGLYNIVTVVLGLILVADFYWVVSTAIHAMK